MNPKFRVLFTYWSFGNFSNSVICTDFYILYYFINLISLPRNFVSDLNDDVVEKKRK